ncbi:uncharacterized protein RJT21DRAFT_113241 [Scheffersomyces amazonensis]|uniref:uncharacterized protein n=1 Tax=Scheffersomyces amazonensis TaxID=1078765 RepID=UPI00315D9FFB
MCSTVVGKNIVTVAVQGCCHGELNSIYKSLNKHVDILIICGDFQALRNTRDLETISVPQKYKRMVDFHEYYKGKRQAPVLTIFIGGNHEASSYLKELKYGGWVAPNIYYLGEFGSVWYKGLQIGGLSGIFNRNTFYNNDIEDEILPYDVSAIRSVYHIKLKNFLKMYLMNHTMDICLSHDWPAYIFEHGDVHKLIKQKKHFKSDIENGSIGSPLNKFLLNYLRPRYWFSSHMHTRFEAIVNYDNEKSSWKQNVDEIELDMDDDEVEEVSNSNTSVGFESQLHIDENDGSRKSNNNQSGEELTSVRLKFPQDPLQTRFLALDKCLPKRKHIEFIDIEVNPNHLDHPSVKDKSGFYYSKRAVAINKVVEEYIINNRKSFEGIDCGRILRNPRTFGLVNILAKLVDEELKKLEALPNDTFKIDPDTFKIIAPPTGVNDVPLKYWENNQTIEYCKKFGVKYTGLKTTSTTSTAHSSSARGTSGTTYTTDTASTTNITNATSAASTTGSTDTSTQ